MIIKSKPISASSGSFAIFNHLAQKIDDNEYIEVLEGSRQNIDNCVTDAKGMNRTNSVIHFILSSDEHISREQALKCTSMLGNEFQFSEDDIMLMAEHGKERHNRTSDNKHWHFLVRANNPETGKTLNLSNAYKRQELVARTFEIENDLKLTQGRHNKYVYHNIDEKYRDLIAPLCEGDLPNSFTNDNSAQQAKRDGRDLFTLKDEAKHIFNESTSWNDFKDKIQARGWTIENGTKKPDVLILNDEKGKLIGSVSRVLGLKKDELNNIIESPDSYIDIASRVVGGTLACPDPQRAGEGLHPVEPPKTSEHTTEAQEQHQEQTTQPQQTAPDQPQISNTETSQEVRSESTDGMTQEEKLAISEFNKQLSEKEKLSKEELSNQEKRTKDFLKIMSMNNEPKLQPQTWNDIIENREKSLLNIIDLPHPKLKSLTQKQTRDFLYKNFKDELDQFYNDRKELCELRKDIRELRKHDKWYNFLDKRNLSKKEKMEEEERKKIVLLSMYLVHMMMYKLRLTPNKPNSINYMTDQQKKESQLKSKENRYAQLLYNNTDRSKCLDAISTLKIYDQDGKIEEWKNRPEVRDAKLSLSKLNDIRDINILTLDERGQKEFRKAQEALDIERARKAVLDAHKREENRHLLDVRPENEQEQNQDNDKEKSNIIEFPKNNKKKKSFSFSR